MSNYEYIETNEDEIPFIGAPFPQDGTGLIEMFIAPVEDVDGYNLYMAQGKKWEEGDTVEDPGDPYGEYYKVNKNLITEDDQWGEEACPGWLHFQFSGTHYLYYYRLYSTSVKDGVESEPSPVFILGLGFGPILWSCPDPP